ncbi:hypothetical protein V6N11_059592 [Hibiscus sabdariffa]|uniref:Uncharacterized protein n=1 Tax=Hibiscus sabdariffa TaxID=183260 RepID=A0ABR2NP73_9ROSI
MSQFCNTAEASPNIKSIVPYGEGQKEPDSNVICGEPSYIPTLEGATQGHTTVPTEVIGKAALGVNYEANGDDGCSVGESVEGASGLVNTNRLEGGFRKENTKRIKGHVDDELLWKYNQCLVNLVLEESSSKEIVSKNCSDASPGKNVVDSDDTLNVLFMGKKDLSKRDDIENSNLKSPRNSGSPPMNDISNGGADELGVKSDLSENGVVSSSDKVMEDILAMGFNKGDLENEAGPTLELLNKENDYFKSNKQLDECSKTISESLHDPKVGYCELPDKLKKRLNKLENDLDMVGHKEKILTELKVCKKQLWDNLRVHEESVKQKSCFKWLRSGDENSAFFHRAIKIRGVDKECVLVTLEAASVEHRVV